MSGTTYSKEELMLAAECCLCLSPKWEDTCGRCPLNTTIDKLDSDIGHCVDALISGLYTLIMEKEKWDME